MASKKKVSKKTGKKKESKKSSTKKNVDKEQVDKEKNKEKVPEKSFKNKGLGIYVFIAVLVGLTVFFILSISDPENDVSDDYEFYNNYEFFRSDFSDEVWVTHVRLGDIDQRAEFRHHPLDLEGIPFDSDSNQYVFLSQLADARVFISWSRELYDNQSAHLSLAGNDLARYFRSFFGFEVRVSVEDSDDYPWVSCVDADINNLVVKVKRGESRVEAEPFCVVLYVDDNRDATKVASLLLYNLFGIME